MHTPPDSYSQPFSGPISGPLPYSQVGAGFFASGRISTLFFFRPAARICDKSLLQHQTKRWVPIVAAASILVVAAPCLVLIDLVTVQDVTENPVEKDDGVSECCSRHEAPQTVKLPRNISLHCIASQLITWLHLTHITHYTPRFALFLRSFTIFDFVAQKKKQTNKQNKGPERSTYMNQPATSRLRMIVCPL